MRVLHMSESELVKEQYRRFGWGVSETNIFAKKASPQHSKDLIVEPVH